ncbi:MAG: hypothetical protein MJY87_05495 [Fibrobacter sp.]|nr:hypothetical protein [Fibrobacter sp.]
MDKKSLAFLFPVVAAGFIACGSREDVKEVASKAEFPSMKIDGDIWMSKNLSVDIPGSSCYQNINENCEIYGRLYTWEAAQKACPEGWHLPESKEVNSLMESAKLRAHREFPDKEFRSREMKECYWNGNTAKVLHSLGFVASSAKASFWAASSNPKNASASFSIDVESVTNYAEIEIRSDDSRQDVFSIRCVKNKFSL